MRCAYEAGDEVTQRQALETLVAHTGKPEYWNDLLKMSERGQGMRDHDTLDVYRLKLLTGTIDGKDEYITLAQLAMQLKFPAEAQAVIEKGQAAKLLTDDRSTKLLALAKSQAAADIADQAKALAAAQAAPKGDAAGQDRRRPVGPGQGQGRRRHHQGRHRQGRRRQEQCPDPSGHGLYQRRPEGRSAEGVRCRQGGRTDRQVGDGRPSLVALRAPLIGSRMNEMRNGRPIRAAVFVFAASRLRC